MIWLFLIFFFIQLLKLSTFPCKLQIDISDQQAGILTYTARKQMREKNSVIKSICKPYLEDRIERRGGGVAIVCKEGYKSEQLTDSLYNSFEYVMVHLRASSHSFIVINIYRPPDTSVASCCDDFSNLLEKANAKRSRLIITGDFNIHVDLNTSAAVKFKETLKVFNLLQHVTTPTHIDGHTLDLLISREDDDLEITRPVTDTLISDHFSILSGVNLPRTGHVYKTLTFRNIRDINIAEFRMDLLSSELITKPETELKQLVQQYNKCLTELLDKHAPEQVKKLSTKSKVPWFDTKAKTQKRICRRAERKWLKTRRQTDLENYKACRNALHKTIHENKSNYYTKLINTDKTKTRLFKIIDSINGRQKESPIPLDIDC